MNLVIDIGNSSIKLAVFDKKQMLFKAVVKHEALEEEFVKIKNKFKILKSIVCSVVDLDEREIEFLKSQNHLLFLDSQTKVPFVNRYATPETLGADRIALISEATFKYPEQAVLVIDAGSCITYDYKNEKNEYLGGAISPGLSMRYKAIHHFTGKLPLLNRESNQKLIGNTTASAIHSGIEHGIIFEINGMVKKYMAENEKLTIILTGGDAEYLCHRLKNCIFANSNFLLEGLNDILDYN